MYLTCGKADNQEFCVYHFAFLICSVIFNMSVYLSFERCILELITEIPIIFCLKDFTFHECMMQSSREDQKAAKKIQLPPVKMVGVSKATIFHLY